VSDVRFAADGAKMTTAFARRGLPAEEAVAWILPRIVGHAVALDLLLSGRVVLGSEAAEIGLVHRAYAVDDLLPAAHAYARDMAEHCSPLAMATAKRQLYLDWERGFVESRTESRRLVGQLKGRSSDFREGVRSFVEKRDPVFEALAEPIDFDDYGPTR
jgi:enoyl-CoA hydratase/carnithine racemase